MYSAARRRGRAPRLVSFFFERRKIWAERGSVHVRRNISFTDIQRLLRTRRMEGCCTCTRGRFFERFNIGDVKEVGNGELISLERNVREKLIKYTRRLDLFSLFREREREKVY